MPERLKDYNEVRHPLAAFREKNGMTIREIAEVLEISPGYAAQIMERWRAPSRELMSKIVKTFNIDAVEILDCPIRPKPSERS